MNFRIGIIIANAVSYKLKIPIIGVLSTEFKNDEEFIKIGIEKISSLKNIEDKSHNDIVLPKYSIKNS